VPFIEGENIVEIIKVLEELPDQLFQNSTSENVKETIALLQGYRNTLESAVTPEDISPEAKEILKLILDLIKEDLDILPYAIPAKPEQLEQLEARRKQFLADLRQKGITLPGEEDEKGIWV
jgi:hypothetical protein